VLFAGTQTAEGDDASLPIASVSLSLDDEIQYRCAGYIQAEIERYAEYIGGGREDEESGQEESGDDSSDVGQAEAGDEDKTKKGKNKKPQPKSLFIPPLRQIFPTNLI